MTEIKAKLIFGDNLKDLMDDAKTNQQELSKLTGLSKTTISMYANGERLPSFKNLVKLADALCCSYDELIPISEPID